MRKTNFAHIPVQQKTRDELGKLKEELDKFYTNVTWDIYPELESNFDRAATEIALNATFEVFGNTEGINIILNPLNASDRFVDGVPFEVHTNQISSLELLQKGDVISLDGQCFSFPGEPGCAVSFEMLESFIRASVQKGVLFHVWRAEWQGLPSASAPAQQALPLSQRRYVFEQKERIKQLLEIGNE